MSLVNFSRPISNSSRRGVKRTRQVAFNKKSCTPWDVMKISSNMIKKFRAKTMELKYSYTNTTAGGNAISTSGVYLDITNAITQGTDQVNRIGDDIWIKDFNYMFVVDGMPITGVASNTSKVRFTIVKYYRKLTVSDFNSAHATAAYTLEPDVVQVLKDEVVWVCNQSAGINKAVLQGKIKCGFKGKYDNTLGTALVGVGVYFESDLSGVGNTTPIYTGWTQIRYYDN